MLPVASSMKCQGQRGHVLTIGLHMIEQSTNGLLFFRGGRGFHACLAYDLTQTSARMYVDRLGLLPIDFFVTFDNFQTVSMCQLAWRRRDHIGVVFEGWVDIQTLVESGWRTRPSAN
jgi:hypothetical protein